MEAGSQILDSAETAKLFMKALFHYYTGPMYRMIEKNPELQKTISGFLINPESVSIYIGKHHLAVEYTGSEILEKLPTGESKIPMVVRDFSDKDGNLLEHIIGFSDDSTSGLVTPLLDWNPDFLWATMKGYDKLDELNWNYSAQDSFMFMNASIPQPIPGKFSRITNGFFFDSDDVGLKTRHIKWMDIFPISIDESHDDYDQFQFEIGVFEQLAKFDINYEYPMPSDYKYKHLPRINRFIELWGNSESSEPQITQFLAQEENQFILTMSLGAVDIASEKECIWQSEDRPNIRPDFFISKGNRVDIVEFKLPSLKGNAVVGKENRESFSATLQSYISQTRVYSSYFDDPNNRKWVKDNYGLDVYKPRRILIVGRRNDFTTDEWREIMSDYRDLEIMTFDDLIDGVVAQFYRK
ncbi:Shedu anti-phage system protein SduA domain-containing protein [Acinetobacter baumannii]